MSDADAEARELRDVLAHIGLHDHLALIYESREEQFAVAIPAIRMGLERGEKCLYVADENTSQDVLAALRAHGVDTDAALAAGKLDIATKRDTYLRGGRFEPDKTIRFWIETVEAAIAAGFTGLCLVAEKTWALDADCGAERLFEYEAKSNDFVRDYPAVVVCQYNRRRFPPDIIANVIRTHPIVICRGVVCRNPYYIPAQEFLASNRAEMEVERLLQSLRDREQAEKALRETRTRFAAFMEHLPAFAWMKDLDGHVVFANAMMKQLPEFQGEWLGKTDFDFWPADIAAQYRATDQQVIATRHSLQMVEPYRSGNETRSVLVSKFPIFDDKGAVVLVGGASVDITDRMRAEQALAASRDFYLSLLDKFPTPIWRAGTDAKCDYFNRTWFEFTGRTMEEEIGDGWTQRVHPDDLEKTVKTYRDAFAARQPFVLEYRLQRFDGAYRDMVDHGSPFQDQNGVFAGFIGSCYDTTERKRAERQVEHFAGLFQSLSHRLLDVQEEERRHLARELHDEIGQALTAAKLNLKIVMPEVPPAGAARLSDSIGILDRLLQQVRQLSLDLRPPLLDDLGLVPALRWLADQQAQRAGVRVHFTADAEHSEIDPRVRTACFRVAQEALTNAIRHAQAKSIAVELRQERDRLRLRVTDDGAGFDPVAVEGQAARGASVGLLSMKERALLAGGAFEINSAPGRGTEIRAWFPLLQPEPPAPA